MDSKKLSAMKSLLLRSWRERWPDTYWSIQAKHLLINDEVDQAGLADLLLQQAMVGSSPNLLVLTYFKHAINTQMIPYTVGIESIMKFEDVTKVYCIKALIEVVDGILPNICCKGRSEDSFRLSRTSFQLLHWLLSTLQKCVHRIKDESLSAEYATVVTKICAVLEEVDKNQSLLALLYIVKSDANETYNDIKEIEMSVRSSFSTLQSPHISAETRVKLDSCLDVIARIGTRKIDSKPILDCSYQPLNASINVLLHIEAVLNTTADIIPVVDQLLTLRKLQGISMSEMLCEILRTCFMGLINSNGGSDELKWAAFTYLKVPQVFVKLSQCEDYNTDDVYKALDMFLSYIPLLDLTDTKCGADCFQLMCKELHGESSGVQLISEQQWNNLMDRRKSESSGVVKFDPSSSQSSGLSSPNLILRAEPTVKSLLKNLEEDYSRNLDGLCKVCMLMGQMMAGKSFDLLLTAASATGRLQTFTAELIKFNEFAKQATGENGRGAQNRAHLFDIMFLMLCHVAQTYGLEVCHSNDPALEQTFFIQWAVSNLPEDGQYKPLDTTTVPDETKIESLLSQIQPSGELRISMTRWHEVCVNIRHATQEVLYAWECSLLTQEQVKGILVHVKNKMCCLSVAMATFLCSYINTADYERRQKPIYMLEQLLEPHVPLDQSQAVGPNQFYNERMHLMHIILKKLCQEVLPLESTYRNCPAYAIPRTTPIQQVMKETWSETFRTGSINTLNLLKLETLLNTGGCQWFCTSLVKEVLYEDRVEDLYKGTCILYSLFSLDLYNLTLCLLHHTIPVLLQSATSRSNTLSGPRGLILAKLAVSCMMLVHSTNKSEKGKVVSKKSRKRTRTEIELEDSDLEDYYRPSKMRKSESSTPLASSSQDLDSAESGYGLLDDNSDNKPSNLPTDTLSIATASLMRLFDNIVQGENISEKTYFIKVFLEEVINSGETLTQYIVQFTPPSMVLQLIKLMPSQFDLDLLLNISDLNSSQGRKIATKVVCQNERSLREKADLRPVFPSRYIKAL